MVTLLSGLFTVHHAREFCKSWPEMKQKLIALKPAWLSPRSLQCFSMTFNVFQYFYEVRKL